VRLVSSNRSPRVTTIRLNCAEVTGYVLDGHVRLPPTPATSSAQGAETRFEVHPVCLTQFLKTITKQSSSLSHSLYIARNCLHVLLQYLALSRTVVTIFSTCFTIRSGCVLSAQCIYVFHFSNTMNCHYVPTFLAGVVGNMQFSVKQVLLVLEVISIHLGPKEMTYDLHVSTVHQ